uniref:Uncharacterized protein n=1 Tax=Neovison vison TaxID=452646 RepID=A0A8C7A7C3_NEOVI
MRGGSCHGSAGERQRRRRAKPKQQPRELGRSRGRRGGRPGQRGRGSSERRGDGPQPPSSRGLRAVGPAAPSPAECRSPISWKLMVVLCTLLLPGSHFIFCNWTQGA